LFFTSWVLVVVIGYCKKPYCLYSRPFEATVLLLGKRIGVGLKNEPLAVGQSEGKLASTVAVELMATAGQTSHLLETSGGFKVGESR
jgi:hypothetical protein